MILWLKRQAIAIGAFLGLLAVTFLYGRKSAQKDSAEEEKQQAIDSMETRNEVQQGVNSRSDSAVDQRLRDNWSRD